MDKGTHEFPQQTLAQCIAAWRGERDLPVNGDENTQEEVGDRHFVAGEFTQAASSYGQVRRPNSVCKAKYGWTSAITGDFAIAKGLLTNRNCGDTSGELAILALIEVGGFGAPLLHSAEQGALSVAQKSKLLSKVTSLLQLCLQESKPDFLVFYVYKDVFPYYQNAMLHLSVAERGLSLFSNYYVVRLWHARVSRLAKVSDLNLLSNLRENTPSKWNGEYAEEIYRTAYYLQDYPSIDKILESATQWVTSEWAGAQVRVGLNQLDLLHSYLDLKRIQQGDNAILSRACTRLNDQVEVAIGDRCVVIGTSGGVTEQRSTDMTVLALRLALACESGDAPLVITIVNLLTSVRMKPETGPGCLDLFSEFLLDNPLALESLDFDLERYATFIESCVGVDEFNKWLFIRAAEAVVLGDEQEDSIETIVAFAPVFDAPGLFTYISAVWFRGLKSDNSLHVMQFANALITYTNWLKTEPSSEIYYGFELSDVSSEITNLLLGSVFELLKAERSYVGEWLVGLFGGVLLEYKRHVNLLEVCELVLEQEESGIALFYAGYVLQIEGLLEDARERYESAIKVNPDYTEAFGKLAIVYRDLDLFPELETLVGCIAEKAKGGSDSWRRVLDIARRQLSGLTAQRAQLQARQRLISAKGSFSNLVSSSLEPENLSLIEAVYLVALVRGCEMDHVNGRLAPFGTTAKPMDPTPGLRYAIIGLLKKGILGIADITSDGAFDVSTEHTRYYLHRITWTFNSVTLELYKSIRQLSRNEWPANWEAQLSILARDLAVEECVQFLEFQAEERQIEPPPVEDMRSVYRLLLEKCSVSRCWYFSYLAAMSANDYRTKYNASDRAVTTRLIRLVDQKASKALEEGYGKDFNRSSSSPRSQLSEAFHDVLTGWEEKAFTTPLHELVI
jgi:tetratricopeptide (TPR) repeat protein